MSKQKPKGSLHTALMLICLLQKIPKHPRSISSTALLEMLTDEGYQLTVRTLQRHLATLTEHFAIECRDDSKPYSYRWLPDASGLAVPTLSEQQSVLLRLADKHLTPLLPATAKNSLDSLFAQANYELHKPDARHVSAREWLNKVGIAPTIQPLLPPVLDDGTIDTVSKALFNNQYLDIRYQAPFSDVQDYRVAPLALVRWGVSLYLVVQFEGFSDYRHLALHRIHAASLAKATFVRPANFILQDYIDGGAFGFSAGDQIKLSFHIAKGIGYHLTETPLSTDQAMQDLGEYYHITATVSDSQMLDWWLARFDDEIWDIKKSAVI